MGENFSVPEKLTWVGNLYPSLQLRISKDMVERLDMKVGQAYRFAVIEAIELKGKKLTEKKED